MVGALVQLKAPALARRGFGRIHDLAGDDGSYRSAFEGASIERGVAEFAGGFGGTEGPWAVERKNGEVRGLAGRDGAFQAEDAPGAGGEKLDDSQQRNAPGVHQLFEGRASAVSKPVMPNGARSNSTFFSARVHAARDRWR